MAHHPGTWAASLRWSGDDKVLVSLDSGYGHGQDGGHDDSPSSTLFAWHGHDEVVMILQDMVMMYSPSSTWAAWSGWEREWRWEGGSSGPADWILGFSCKIFSKNRFLLQRYIYQTTFCILFFSIVESPAKAHRDVLVGFLLLEGHLLQGDLVFRIFGIWSWI